MPNPRAWAIGSDRDSRISDPSRAHVASFKPSSGTYRCVKCGDHTSQPFRRSRPPSSFSG
jgi:hypothetical protein